MELRPATADDSEHIAFLTNLAGEGLPEYLWRMSAPPGTDPFAHGAARAASPEGNFSYRHVVIAEDRRGVLGMLLSMAQPDPYPLPDFSQLPPQVGPLIELEALAPGSFYINAVATYEACRGEGVGTRLMAEAGKMAGNRGIGTLSLIVASENPAAERLYRRLGYTARAARPVVGYPGIRHGGEWILMVKTI